MTLCIAANVRSDFGEDAIVCCFDFRIETSTAGSNTGYKFRKLSADWGAMLSGNVSRADRLLDTLTQELSAKDIPQQEAVTEIRKVVANYRRELVEEYVQSTLSLTYEQFLQQRDSFPEHLFNQIAQQLLQIRQDCDLILFNLKYKTPFLYAVSADGLVDQHRNFCAVGTGASNAEAWLHFREQHSFDPLDKTILSVYEAKKFSEHAPSVGKTTRLAVIRGTKALILANIKNADQIWRRYGPRGLPKSWTTEKELFPLSDFMQFDWENINIK